MKEILLFFISILIFSNTSFAQKGYQWLPGTSMTSVPAYGGSAATYTLGALGSVTSSVVSSVVGIGGCSSGSMNVRQIIKPAGFSFTNDPQFINKSYTIEMVVNMSPNTGEYGWRRLLGFTNLTYTESGSSDHTPADNGLYIVPDGTLIFYHADDDYLSPSQTSMFVTSKWTHLLLTRDSATKEIKVYLDNNFIGAYTDSSDDFVPKSDNSNKITFFKDNSPTDYDEETDTLKLAKLAIFNFTLSPSQIAQRFVNSCNDNILQAPSWKISGNDETDSSHFIGTTTAQPLLFKTNSNEVMRIDTNGNTGVGGRPRTGYRLSVAGNLLTEKVTVKALVNWPDYVFDKKYPLLPLKQLEDFILKNKHLPGISAAKEIHIEGIDIGQQQTILLRKVEELTLYIIEQDKEIEAQEKRIRQLEQGKRKRK